MASQGKDIRNLTSMDILKDFINSELKLYEGIEITIQRMLRASVKVTVESVVESLVSRDEKYFDKERNLHEDNAMDEIKISENGPTIFKADNILKTAMNKY